MLAVLLVKIYFIIWLILTPFIPLIFIFRIIKGKEKYNRINERIGFPKIQKPDGNLIWINAASIGELRSTIPLIKGLLKKNITVLITTVTVTSAIHIKSIIADIDNKNIIHQFTPIDHPLFIKKFLAHWKPNLLILIESEIWPHIILESYNKNISLILLQGRMSEKSYKKWLFFKPLSKYLYNRFSLIVSQDITNEKRYKVLGGRNIISDINLKNAVAPNHMSQKDQKEIVLQISKRQILLFASIHDNIEDQASIISHIQAKKYNKNLLTIIVPRHPKKIKNLVALTNAHNLKTRIRSYNQAIDYNTEIYIADTIGELGTFMQIADICFVGGSLSNKGGHNLIEPAMEKCAIIYGPDVSNHKNTSDMLLKEGAAIQVQNIDELNIEIGNLILNKEKITKMASDAYKIITNIPSPSSILLNKLEPYL